MVDDKINVPVSPLEFFKGIDTEVISAVVGEELYPELLWHYTSAEGLLGILTDNKIRFSDAKYLNDRVEVDYGIRIFHECIESYKETKPSVEHNHFDLLRTLVDDFFRNFSVLVFSMCDDGNLLNQWRDYGRDIVPYSIGFDGRSISHLENMNFQNYTFKIIYDSKIQYEIMWKIMDGIYDKAIEIPDMENLTEDNASQYRMSAALQVVSMILRFKHFSFAAEREYRLVSFFNQADIPKAKFKTSNLGVVPYYEWFSPEGNQRFPIDTIVVGPSTESDISNGALRLFLKEVGYSDVKTDFSIIPIR